MLFLERTPVPEVNYKRRKPYIKYFLDQAKDLHLTGREYKVYLYILSSLQEGNLVVTAATAARDLKLHYSHTKAVFRLLQAKNIIVRENKKRYLNPRIAWYSQKGLPVPDESLYPEIITEKMRLGTPAPSSQSSAHTQQCPPANPVPENTDTAPSSVESCTAELDKAELLFPEGPTKGTRHSRIQHRAGHKPCADRHLSDHLLL